MARSDRPWSRHLIRTGIRLMFGRRRAHMQDWFPGLSIRAEGGKPTLFFRGCLVAALQQTEALATRAGRDMHIVGSGPSIRHMDMTRLPPRSAILLNGAIALMGTDVAEPLAIAIEDERFVFRHFSGLMQAVSPGSLCLLSVSVMRAICERDPSWLAGKTIVPIDNILKPYGAPRRSFADFSGEDFVALDGTRAGISLDPDRGVFPSGSVAVSALQFALACKPGRIGFAGIDISNAAEPRFYEDGKTSAFSGVAGAERRILDHIALAIQVGRAKGIQFLNFSPVSALAKLGLTYDAYLARSDADGFPPAHNGV